MEPCDDLKITILDDNYVDMLLPDTPLVTRLGMAAHFDPSVGTPLAENGIAFLIEVTTKGITRSILLDAGLTSEVVLHNAAILGVDLSRINHVVLSHGHPDHFGGLFGVISAIGHPVPVAVHPDAFNPRYISGAAGVMPFMNIGLTPQRLEEAGGAVVATTSPLPLAPGVMTSGPVEHSVDFEYDEPGGRLCVRDGLLEEDHIRDYQTVIINLKDKGLVILDPCGHSGVISNLEHARKLTGVDKIHAVLGGFHLGHLGISQEKIDRTVQSLVDLDVDIVAPMHCSGFRTISAVLKRMPEQFQIMTPASVLNF